MQVVDEGDSDNDITTVSNVSVSKSGLSPDFVSAFERDLSDGAGDPTGSSPTFGGNGKLIKLSQGNEGKTIRKSSPKLRKQQTLTDDVISNGPVSSSHARMPKEKNIFSINHELDD